MSSKSIGIKKTKVESEYSPHEISELKRCKEDPIYFLENYVKVSHPKHGSMKFKLYDYQREMVRGIHENRDVIMLASRQLGKCVHPDTKVITAKAPEGIKKFLYLYIARFFLD